MRIELNGVCLGRFPFGRDYLRPKQVVVDALQPITYVKGGKRFPAATA